jgi:ankyrin repeat protein
MIKFPRVFLLIVGLLLVNPLVAASPDNTSIANAQERFFQSMLNSDLLGVKAIIKQRPKILFETNKNGFTILHLAATEDEIEIQTILIQAGANVNAKNKYGATPLHMASHPEFAELLLRSGADVNSLAADGETPLHSIAVERDKNDVFEVLLKFGANQKLKNKWGETALDLAKSRKDSEKIRLLRKYMK